MFKPAKRSVIPRSFPRPPLGFARDILTPCCCRLLSTIHNPSRADSATSPLKRKQSWQPSASPHSPTSSFSHCPSSQQPQSIYPAKSASPAGLTSARMARYATTEAAVSVLNQAKSASPLYALKLGTQGLSKSQPLLLKSVNLHLRVYRGLGNVDRRNVG